MPVAGAARPARFDPSSQHRRSLLAKVHLAKKELALVDDDYRAMLARVTGRTSAGDCDEGELVAMVEEMKRQGFQARPRSAARPDAPRRPAPASHPSAGKARAMWISLHQLGAIDNPSEAALEAFARRQLKVERLQWANQAQAYKLIEALKAIAERHGWPQDLGGTPANRAIKTLKLRLCRAILDKLKAKDFAGGDWTLGEAGFRLLGMAEAEFGGPEFWELGKIDLLAQGLGRKLRGQG